MKTALLVIDFINDIVHPDGKTPVCAAVVAAGHTIARANQALAFARQQQWLPVLVKVGFSPGYPEQPKTSAIFGKAHTLGALQLGQWGTQFHEALDAHPEDAVMIKHRVSPFYATSLETILRAHRIERLAVCGVSTSWAIQSTVREAHDRDYPVILLEDACAAATPEEHEHAIQQLSRIAQVLKVEQLPGLA